MQTLWQDLRYGARMLGKQPAFTLIAVLTLALGIGATTTIFSGLDALVWRPFSFANQERLVMIHERKLDIGVDRSSVAPAKSRFRSCCRSAQGYCCAASWQCFGKRILGSSQITWFRCAS
ncbi:MAG: hypothetical protein ACREEM_00095 [Blastocatellia bacterium]